MKWEHTHICLYILRASGGVGKHVWRFWTIETRSLSIRQGVLYYFSIKKEDWTFWKRGSKRCQSKDVMQKEKKERKKKDISKGKIHKKSPGENRHMLKRVISLIITKCFLWNNTSYNLNLFTRENISGENDCQPLHQT